METAACSLYWIVGPHDEEVSSSSSESSSDSDCIANSEEDCLANLFHLEESIQPHVSLQEEKDRFSMLLPHKKNASAFDFLFADNSLPPRTRSTLGVTPQSICHRLWHSVWHLLPCLGDQALTFVMDVQNQAMHYRPQVPCAC